MSIIASHGGARTRPDLSIVVPVLNEEENVVPLVQAVREALEDLGSWELILVDDGSDDETAARVERCIESDSRVRLVSLARRYGQSTAMQAGFDHSRAEIIVTMDGDLQNDPRDIPVLISALEAGHDLVAGYRERRKDLLVTRKIPSWIANRVIAGLTGVQIRDNGCSLKAYRRGLLERMQLYSDMHRFIPALAAGTAGARITEVPVRHHARVRGKSKYGLSRVGKVLVDLMTIKMIRSFRTNPLRMFGGGALLTGFLGLFFVALSVRALGAEVDIYARSVVFPSVSLLWFALSLFLLMLGLVGQVAVSSQQRSGRSPGALFHEVLP